MLTDTATHAHPEFSPPRLFISYSRSDGRAFAEEFEWRIAAEGLTSWRDLKGVEGGDDIRAQVLRAIEDAEHLVLILTRASLESDWVKREWMHARERGVKVSPVLGDLSLRKRDLPKWAQRADVYDTTEPERWAKLVSVLKGEGKSRSVTYMGGHLPASFVPRPAQFEHLKELVLTTAGGTVGLSTALVGAGGYGKTTLANALCRDEDVRFEFWDGVIRVEIGKERMNVLDLIVDVIEKLDPEGRRPGFQDEKIAGEHLAEVLGDARALLVLDDVWRESHLRPFLIGGPNCVRLITTRLPRLLPETCENVDVDELETGQALELLSWKLPVKPAPARSKLVALARRLEGWAQILEIANGWLRERLKKGEDLQTALDRFAGRLDRDGLTLFDPTNPDARNRAIQVCVDASIEDLDEAERARFEELAVIPEDADAPIGTIELFWERTGGIDEDAADKLLGRLASLSLLQSLDLSARTARLHDNMKWLLRRRIGPARLAQAHGAMADVLTKSGNGNWSQLPPNDAYGWQFGIVHLRSAGRNIEADSLLTDYDWIKAKLMATDAHKLLAAWQPEPSDPDARLAGHAVALSVPTLLRWPGQLPKQLWGRLGSIRAPRIVALLRSASFDPFFWPGSRWSDLTPPGPALLQLVGHKLAVRSTVFSPDGTRVLTASEDRTARLWDAATGAENAVLLGHRGPVSNAVFSHDGAQVLTASEDWTARLWDAATGAESAVLGGHEGWVTDAVFSPDGARVLTASEDWTARLWDAATGAESAVLRGHVGRVRNAVFSPDGTRLLTASEDRTARLWDAATGAESAVLRRHEHLVWKAVFSPDGTRILTASGDGTARLWDAATGAETAVLTGHGGSVASAVFSPDGTRVLITTNKWTVRLWDAITGAEDAVLRGHDGQVCKAVFSPDGARVLTASGDGTARLWDAATGAETAVLRGHENQVADAVFSPDGTRVLTGSLDGTARLWDVTNGADTAVLRGHGGSVADAAFSPDGTRVLTASDDSTARLWDAATGAETAVFRGHGSVLTGAVFSTDGTRVLTSSFDYTARFWDAANGAETAILRGHEDVVWKAVFSPDGTRVLTASDDRTARLWDLTTGAGTAVLRGHEGSVASAVFSPDGTRVLTGSRDGTARLWDAATGAEIAIMRGHEDSVQSAVFSPDGTRILTASGDGTARLWDAGTGAETAVLRGHGGSVTGAVFSPDGTRVLTGSFDHTARLWDAAAGGETAILRGHEGLVWKSLFSPDGRRVVTASRDRTARLWDAATGAETACIVMDARVTSVALNDAALVLGDNLGRIHVYDL